ncbi:hypothetical protein [Weissella viridescens]|uniref:hypothetical protein n=1 Tax=Weissella viridescens TaxID=1629 RepID=UPI003AF272C1
MKEISDEEIDNWLDKMLTEYKEAEGNTSSPTVERTKISALAELERRIFKK